MGSFSLVLLLLLLWFGIIRTLSSFLSSHQYYDSSPLNNLKNIAKHRNKTNIETKMSKKSQRTTYKRKILKTFHILIFLSLLMIFHIHILTFQENKDKRKQQMGLTYIVIIVIFSFGSLSL